MIASEVNTDSLMGVTFSRKDTFIEHHFASAYKEKYKGETYNYEDKKKNAFQEWLEKKDKNKQISEPSPFWPMLFKIMVILALAYGVFIVIGLLLGKKGNWLFNNQSESRALQYGEDGEDITDADFSKQIHQAMLNGDFRLAIRYQYLNTLQKLDQKSIIRYHKEKTNTDYGYEIKNKDLSTAFRYISYIYDHAWYGGFEVTEVTYRAAALAYEETNKMI